jgi:hypothetical protein
MNVFCHLSIICWTFLFAEIWISSLFNGRELFNNNMTGRIPEELGNLTNLVSLDLYLNNLSGTIPNTLANLQKLRFLFDMLSLFSYLWSAKFIYLIGLVSYIRTGLVPNFLITVWSFRAFFILFFFFSCKNSNMIIWFIHSCTWKLELIL